VCNKDRAVKASNNTKAISAILKATAPPLVAHQIELLNSDKPNV
jgi:hypothetical protein